MSLKRDNWTNDEVINILEGCKIYIGERERSDAQLKNLKRHNEAIEQAIIRFWDFKSDADEFGSMAYDTETKRLYHIGNTTDTQ
jgi:hypothetical protein